MARGIGAELDVTLARKLRAPNQPEFALGALSEDGPFTGIQTDRQRTKSRRAISKRSVPINLLRLTGGNDYFEAFVRLLGSRVGQLSLRTTGLLQDRQ